MWCLAFNKNRRSSTSGFTLIELSISLIFLSTLSLIVALMVSNAVSSYNKGLTMGRLNTEGADLVDEFRGAVQGSPATSMEDICETLYEGNETVKNDCESDKGKGFVIHKKFANVELKNNETLFSVPIYGVFCTGKYSYLWNSGYLYSNDVVKIDDDADKVGKRVKLKYKYATSIGASEASIEDFRLIRVMDDDRAVCKAAAGYQSGSNAVDLRYLDSNNIVPSETIDISGGSVVGEEPIELINGATPESSLALYDFSASLPAVNKNFGNMFYVMSFVLGTIRGGANVMAMGDFCKAPDDHEHGLVQNFDYCAINKFNFAAQTVGGN